MAPQPAAPLPPGYNQAPTTAAGIPKETLLGVAWGGVSISFAFVLFRAYVRLRIFRKFSIDDYFLALAWLLALSNAILWQIRTPEIYFGIELASGKVTSYPTDLGTWVDRYTESTLASFFIQYCGLWCVKLTLLFFFRGLSSKVRPQGIIWWIVCAFIVASFFVFLGTIDYGCSTSKFPDSIKKCTTSKSNMLFKKSCLIITALDILTDASLIFLSTNILWKIRISWRRKLALTGIFSLTIFVIIVAILRVVFSMKSNMIDVTYLFTWGGVELFVAVIIACLASFRTLYTATKNEKSQESSGIKTSTPFSKSSGAYNNISDDIPLHKATLNHTTEISNGSGASISETKENIMSPNSQRVYVRQEYGVHSV